MCSARVKTEDDRLAEREQSQPEAPCVHHYWYTVAAVKGTGPSNGTHNTKVLSSLMSVQCLVHPHVVHTGGAAPAIPTSLTRPTASYTSKNYELYKKFEQKTLIEK